ncbi:MAG: tRNA (adenosine(37)-N6)-threonylcarbamoyltransferase complex transferase subunit TsaD [Verrucomicrobiota bacterium]|nr:tRNA (adenosine(37)-N6)-threonylcarbamoyltransferase complex transferase subunit TsaD [Verrucomicrobiota bacterium]
MSTVLAFETSCDETAVAIMRGRELLASEIASQTLLHEQYGGVVPEVASRNHLLHAPRLLELAMRSARVSLGEIDCFAATSGPGLATSLMIGASVAKGLAIGLRKPYLAINHLEGHLLSPFLGPGSATPATDEIERNVSLVVSGGHTLLVEVDGIGEYRVLGRTVDDAAGEAFDKVAKMLGLGYPGGPEIEKHARGGDPRRFEFPRSMLDSGNDNFSFSGLKTAVRYTLAKLSLPNEQLVADICASFQAAVIDVLVRKTIAAAKAQRVSLVTLSGGVSCNNALRDRMKSECERCGLRFISAPNALTTDNAAMIAFAALLRFQQGFTSEVTEEIDPNLVLA